VEGCHERSACNNAYINLKHCSKLDNNFVGKKKVPLDATFSTKNACIELLCTNQEFLLGKYPNQEDYDRQSDTKKYKETTGDNVILGRLYF
jgi:hypothetical protein